MKRTNTIYLCGFEKLSGPDQDRVLRFIEFLREQDAIEKKFSCRTSAFLCRECRGKTRYTTSNFMDGRIDNPCELCGTKDELIGICSSWSFKK